MNGTEDYEPTTAGFFWFLLAGLSALAYFVALVVTGTGPAGESGFSMQGVAGMILAIIVLHTAEPRKDTFAYSALFLSLAVFAQAAWTGGLSL